MRSSISTGRFSGWDCPTISLYHFDTQRVTRIGTVDKEPVTGDGALAVSPDGRWVLYPQVDRVESHIMLVDNFH